MAVELDFADIQGNILSAYGKEGFPKGRFMLFHIEKGELARQFVSALLPMITTALRWPSKQHIPTGKKQIERPDVTVNIAFTWYGLVALGIPTRTLRGMPDEFIDGMTARAPMLGDDFTGPLWKKSWDEVWTNSGQDHGTHPDTVHFLITLNSQMNPDGSAVSALEEKTQEIEDLARGVRLLTGHNRPGQQKQKYQELSALFERVSPDRVKPLPKEHFGFTDAIGDPVFEGQYPNDYEQVFQVGNGAFDGKGNWRPLATGEFLLGYPDEAQEIAGAAMPHGFSRNGTFMAYRKLHQNVRKFREFIQEKAQVYAKFSGIGNLDDASELLKAKMAGRWSDGVPVSRAPTVEEWKHFFDPSNSDPNARYKALTDFKFRYPKNDRGEPDHRDDPEGTRCPLTAHVRRVNTRDMMDPTGGPKGSVLNNRRRILRRGLPYGESPEDTQDEHWDEHEHGIVMLVTCASLFRQFEFVQQQWLNYGNDSRAGNDTCPIVGNHSDGTGGEHGPKAKFVIPANPASGHLPFIIEGIPQFVETRGGEYFFVPSMTALRMIGMGVVDPT
jgi:Dyp-type peroxidase family